MPVAGTVDSTQDRNQVYTIMGLSGTLGPTYGTAQPRPVTVTNDGALNVNASVSIPPIGSISNIGSLDAVGSVYGIGGVVQISGTVVTGGVGTQPVEVIKGTLQSSGTTTGVGTVTNLGSFTNGGTIKEITNIAGGTITTSVVFPDPVGSVVVTQGTIASVGTLPGQGTLTNVGSLTNVGTVKEVTLVPTVSSVGTVPGVGTLTNLGSFTNGGTIKEIANIAGGTITTTLALNTGTITTIAAGTQNTLGTVGVINAGSLVVTVGTVGGKAASGAASVANPVQIAGTDGGGTVYSPLVSTAGVMSVGGAVTIGTLAGLGTVTNVGSLTNIGTIKEAGIVTSVSEVVKGTTTLVTRTSNLGTLELGSVVVTTLPSGGTLLNLATGTVAVVSNLTNGSVNLLTGTVTSVSNLAGGTIKLDPTSIPQMVQFGTLGTAGGSFFGTISAASGAGTKHYIQGVDIVLNTGTADVRILAGTSIQGTGVLAAGNFVQGGGLTKNWWPHFNTGTNSELIYHFVGAGTAFITVSYWKGA